MKPLLCLLAALASAVAWSQGEDDAWMLELHHWSGSSELILLTGFGPFGDVEDNPSGRIVEPLGKEISAKCGAGLKVEAKQLDVKPGIIDSLPLESYGRIVNIGVAPSAHAIRVETEATNYYYDPDTGIGGPIDPDLPEDATAPSGPLPDDIADPVPGFRVELGGKGTAGTYVCNDTFYRVCSKGRAGYFIHIPNSPPSKDRLLASGLADVACRILRQSPVLLSATERADFHGR
jgi:pyroglutamyl-peptidase